jgi:hypothetical protein
MEPTLEVFEDSRRVFASAGKWLHPLFELEEFLAASDLDPARLLIRDKIVGKAAALLIARLGFRRLHARLLSRLGREILSRYSLDVVWDELVERIDCQTEGALAEVDDLEEAYLWLRRRAEAAAGR